MRQLDRCALRWVLLSSGDNGVDLMGSEVVLEGAPTWVCMLISVPVC